MSKNLKSSYILFFIFSAIIIAWRTLLSFFNGVGVNFVALIGLTFGVLLLVFKDKDLFKRIKDLFIIACAFCILEAFVYFAFEFGIDTSFKDLKAFLIYQNVLSILSFFFFTYIAFRFVCEMKGKRIKFIEIILGNEKPSIRAKKIKTTKEISNGCLEEKPNQKSTQFEAQEENIIIETEEE